VNNPEREALNFLHRYPTAKIIVVLDTHSTENGAFVYQTNSKSVDACFMLEVSLINLLSGDQLLIKIQIISECIPKSIYPFISNQEGTPTHHHKTIILNLSCGSSVNMTMAREHLYEG
jgi:hypothetical protein